MFTKIICSFILGLLLLITTCTATKHNMKEEIVLTIYPYRVPCVGESVQLCYRMKINDGELQYYYDKIEGFDFEWGYAYRISVDKVAVSNPMTNASTFKYKLKKVLKKEKVAATETFELPLKMEGRNLIERKNAGCYYLGEQKIQTGKYSCEELALARSAVFSHDKNGQGLVVVSLK